MQSISGVVIKGKKRGKKLGFPTANFIINKKMNEGIYISLTRVNNKKYPSLTFIGAAISFGETKIQAETYILSFDKDIYNKEIGIELIKKIRDNIKFGSEEELIKQMDNDKKIALEYFKNQNV